MHWTFFQRAIESSLGSSYSKTVTFSSESVRAGSPSFPLTAARSASPSASPRRCLSKTLRRGFTGSLVRRSYMTSRRFGPRGHGPRTGANFRHMKRAWFPGTALLISLVPLAPLARADDPPAPLAGDELGGLVERALAAAVTSCGKSFALEDTDARAEGA